MIWKELIENPGRNDPCPCGSGLRFPMRDATVYIHGERITSIGRGKQSAKGVEVIDSTGGGAPVVDGYAQRNTTLNRWSFECSPSVFTASSLSCAFQ